ncbi:MoaD/ThiS family protein [Hyphococcus luteus]|uniref:Molybdopterin synthase sulfur carrier subunit n=1 Tax=Hyphococcus luteus TaxID=2058213 RepID=A0A2S7K320_9PROT|nr:MoaD/ThiS family protein [Marinicaulis flavus]PQA86904.1 molybdopterin synthase sulfur carrier subunit [Marinicaulis flavus]
MARLLFFGKLADAAGARARQVKLEPETRTIDDLVAVLGDEDAALGASLNEKSVRFIVNETLASRDAAIGDKDEIAFLPPVSGG